MSPRRRLPPVPQYRDDARPPHLLTLDELQALRLKPGQSAPDAIWRYEQGGVRGMCGVYDRSAAVPVEDPAT